ncbi:hypothetical protein U1Q18_052789 [Sarracenia purpurea var. burkii]
MAQSNGVVSKGAIVLVFVHCVAANAVGCLSTVAVSCFRSMFCIAELLFLAVSCCLCFGFVLLLGVTSPLLGLGLLLVVCYSVLVLSPWAWVSWLCYDTGRCFFR